VTRVAREVGTEGKLGGQARVEGVSGTWKDLTDSVNGMAGNLTTQVRNIVPPVSQRPWLTATVIAQITVDAVPRAETPWTMFRTCVVRLPAMPFTESVRSFHCAAHALDAGLAAELALVPTSRATRVTSDANDRSWSTIVLMVFLQLQELALHVHRDLLGQVAVGDGGGHLGDVPHLAGQVAGHAVDGVGHVLPRPGHALHLGLAAELALGAHLAGHPGHFRGERRQLVHHRVDGLGGAQELPLERPVVDLQGHRLRQVALRDRPDHAGRLDRRVNQVVDQVVHRPDRLPPEPADVAERQPLPQPALLRPPTEPGQLLAIRSFSSTTSLKASATLPATPVQSDGRRTPVRPCRRAVRASSNTAISVPFVPLAAGG